jgi:hypothetical protein
MGRKTSPEQQEQQFGFQTHEVCEKYLSIKKRGEKGFCLPPDPSFLISQEINELLL